MIDALINILDSASAVVPVAKRSGLAELRPNPTGGTYPVKHVGAGEYQPVADDMGGTWSYWRLLNDGITSEAADVMEGCSGLRYTMRLRLVMYVARDGPCEDITKAMTTITNSVRANTRVMRTALRAVNVSVQSATLVTGGVYDSEFGKTGANIPTGKQLIAIDFALIVLGTEACILTCGDVVDLTCAIIDKASNAKVEECLGAERIAEICGGTDSCPMTVVIRVDGDVVDTLNDIDPCEDQTYNINITYS